MRTKELGAGVQFLSVAADNIAALLLCCFWSAETQRSEAK